MTIATIKTQLTKAAIIFFLKIELKSDNSGKLAPAPPKIRAITTPGATPFAIKILATGIIVSVRMYIGIPTTAAIGIAIKSLTPAKLLNKSAGITSWINAPILAPSKRYGKTFLNSATEFFAAICKF